MIKTMIGLVLLSVALCTPASAANPPAPNWYVSVNGGFNQSDIIEIPFFVDDNSGYTVGGAVGTWVDAVPGLRIEAELGYRQNAVDLFGGFLQADHNTFTLMANAAYTIPVELGPVRPYVLGGIGYGATEIVLENIALAKLEASGVTYQLGAGLETDVAQGVTFGVGYRYVVAPEVDIFGIEVSDGTNHAVTAELRFAFP